jgi:1-acyl-sn-glycerol-3-phosphate acyltransferase
MKGRAVDADASERMLRFLESGAGHCISRALITYFRGSLEGDAHLPREGPALLVANHAAFGLDSFVLIALVARQTGRYVRFVGERELARLAPVRRLFDAAGVLPGDHAEVLTALAHGEWVGVYPGGIEESLKTRAQRHRLLWDARTGFAQLALRARVPIVPIAGLGIDDTYHTLLREKWLGRRWLGSPRYDFALGIGALGSPLPLRARHRFVACEPIQPDGDPDDANDVWRLRCAAHDALERELMKVRGLDPLHRR